MLIFLSCSTGWADEKWGSQAEEQAVPAGEDAVWSRQTPAHNQPAQRRNGKNDHWPV